MENFLICVGAILPMFLIIALGYFLKQINIISEKFALEANEFAFKVFLPFMLFINIYTADIHTAVDVNLIIFTLITLIVSFIIIWLTVVVLYKNNYRRGVIIQGMYRSNFVILGLPVATNICGLDCAAVIGLLLAVVLPCYNVFSILALEVFNSKNQAENNNEIIKSKKAFIKKICLQIVKNPLIIATALAFIFVLLEIKIPKILLQPMTSVADVAPAFCLMVLGAFLKFSGVKDHLKELIAVISVRLVVVPVIIISFAVLFGFTGMNLVALLAIFATPTAVAGFTMAKMIGGDGTLAANIVVFTSFISMFTMFVFTYFLMNLGLI